VSDEIAKLKYKEPQSTKIVQLEQELVRAEAQSLVAEAQLSNIVWRLRNDVRHLLTVLDPSEVQGGVRPPLCSHDRTCREADHPSQARSSSLEPCRRYPHRTR
jgi:hypothetical protein